MIINPNHIIKVIYRPEKLLNYTFVPKIVTKNFFGKVKIKEAYFIENVQSFRTYVYFDDLDFYGFIVKNNKLYSRAEIKIIHTNGTSCRNYNNEELALIEYNNLKNELKNYNFIKF